MAHAFRKLEDLELDAATLDTPLPLGPSDLLHGTLDNGMKYYIRAVNKPKQRAALALAVNIGSLVEEEGERGLAHIVEHLAFNATEKYSNHDLVKFLESIGAQFGPCQNAYTTCDETVYELEVPTDDDKFLEQAFSVFAEFATKIRCAAGDLAKERGAVLEELRMANDSAGRLQQAHWKLILKGSKYADRMPIGLEEIIRKAPATVVRGFYEKWYRPENMAVVVVGDFGDCNEVLRMLRDQLEGCQCRSSAPPPERPRYNMVPHTEPRIKSFADKELQQTTVYVSFQRPAVTVATVNDFTVYMTDELFEVALNRRLYQISRQKEPPFYSASCASSGLCNTVASFVLQALVAEGGIIKGLEALLTELARVRLHGFSEREIKQARNTAMSDIEALYMEKDQVYGREVRDEYVRHFLHGECVTGREYEARLSKTLLPRISEREVTARAQAYRTNNSCVIKVVSHNKACSEEQLEAAMEGINRLEARGEVGPWEGSEAPEELIPESELPSPGSIVHTCTYEAIGATELILSNGMRVCYKRTDFLDDQILLMGYAVGGLSETPEKDLRTASLGVTLASELGMFGYKPEVMLDILSGKRCEIKAGEGAYYRTFSGEQSPVDLETAFQMLHKLFMTTVVPVPSELETIMKCLKEATVSQMRSPDYKFGNRVRTINYGDCYYFRPVTLRDLDRVNADAACAHFSQAFKNPAEFTVCLTGTLDEEQLQRLVCLYLASIPPCDQPAVRRPQQVTPLPFSFPENAVVENIRARMVVDKAQAIITFPTQILMSAGAPATGENQWLAFSCMILETKLMQALRFKQGEVYTVSVSPDFSLEAPSKTSGPLRGDVNISFTCDPEAAERLTKLTLEVVSTIQEWGPAVDEVDTVLNLEQRSWETQQYENRFWLDMLVSSYQSRLYQREQDLDKVYKLRLESRQDVRDHMSPYDIRDALRRLYPFPCTARYTAITLLPQEPLHQIIGDALWSVTPSRDKSVTYWLVAASILAVAGAVSARYLVKR